jgi:NADPH-dependent 2,4-dienoyl-CoA reductase/sulfur reductase-like enzyme
MKSMTTDADMAISYPRKAPSGIKVIIVGAGFAGLTAAIECHRKGHDVTVFEKVADLKPLGDIISFGQVCAMSHYLKKK